MTYDFVTVLRECPDEDAYRAAVEAAGEGLTFRSAGNEAILQFCDEAGEPLVSVELPLLVRVPGEIERLLGDLGGIAVPAWWLEIRAQERDEAGGIARVFAEELVRRAGGVVWAGDPPRSAGPVPWEEGSR